ncbi:MAG: RNA polymerase sigma factor [Bryobacterales bacterium]|nr:RNA polymerase sigma factor [Bryobacterales bacterium]
MLVAPETIQRAQSGDDEAFGEIIQAYRKRILGTVYRIISRGDDVEDVGQEVFVRLYDSLSQLRTPQVFEPWLYRLTVNACYDYLRRKRREIDVRMADLSEEQVVAIDAALSGRRAIDDSEKAGAKELLEVVLGRVSSEDRLLLVLKEIEGLSLKELSAVYKVNTNVLKVRLFRARKRALKAYGKITEEASRNLARLEGDRHEDQP